MYHIGISTVYEFPSQISKKTYFDMSCVHFPDTLKVVVSKCVILLYLICWSSRKLEVHMFHLMLPCWVAQTSPRLGPSTSLATFGTDSWHLGGAGLGDCGDRCHTLVTFPRLGSGSYRTFDLFFGWFGSGGEVWFGTFFGVFFVSKRFEIGLFVCLLFSWWRNQQLVPL